jgi:murein DD-endopeptidase MepM/ murein hydrolase activator NlpD
VAALVLGLLAALAGAPWPAAPAGAAPAHPSGVAVAAAPAETFDQLAANPELTDDHARVFRLYWAFFGRAPDPDGARYWIAQRNQCAELTTIANSFAASTEFTARYGTLDDSGFVNQIYRNVLDRQADPDGLGYWRNALATRRLDRGGVVLYISLSGELTARHPYPSDGVRPRSCQTPDGKPTGRAVDILTGSPLPALATVAGLTLQTPASVVERAGFHQSTHPGAQEMTAAAPAPVRLSTMPSRDRGTIERGAVDVVVQPSTPIKAPISGSVKRAGTYTLYCRYQDSYLVIAPDARPDLEVKLLHLRDLAVKPGQRVTAGDKVAGQANKFPFSSQIDDYTVSPSWPHVHLEVVDPSVPRPPGSGC